MTDDITVLRALYARFNARDVDAVLTALTDAVARANAMEGGHVHGHAGVRDCWTRQWALVSPPVEPVSYQEDEAGRFTSRSARPSRTYRGRPLAEQTHGLAHKTVGHVFHKRNGKVRPFDVRGAR